MSKSQPRLQELTGGGGGDRGAKKGEMVAQAVRVQAGEARGKPPEVSEAGL